MRGIQLVYQMTEWSSTVGLRLCFCCQCEMSQVSAGDFGLGRGFSAYGVRYSRHSVFLCFYRQCRVSHVFICRVFGCRNVAGSTTVTVFLFVLFVSRRRLLGRGCAQASIQQSNFNWSDFSCVVVVPGTLYSLLNLLNIVVVHTSIYFTYTFCLFFVV